MWRYSCIIIGAVFPVILPLVVLCSWIDTMLGSRDTLWRIPGRLGERIDLLRSAVKGPVFLVLNLTGFIYVCARVNIVVEAFISIRSVPLGSFETVDWLRFWPHM